MHLFEAGTASATNPSTSLAATLSRDELFDPSVIASTYTGAERVPYPRGRALGGTTAVNALVQMWGTREDWDAWTSVHGCTGWNWQSVSGEMRTLGLPSYVPKDSDGGVVTAAMVEAARKLGASRCTHTAETADGAGPVALSIDGSRRADAFEVFVAPRVRVATGRMVVHAGSAVQEVGIEAGWVSSVVLDDGTEHFVDGVVVAAGTVWSPVILRRSGISRAGLGRNLKDHASLSLTFGGPAIDAAPQRDVDVTSLVVASTLSDSDVNLLPVDPAQLVVAVTKVSSVGHVIEVAEGVEVVLGTLTTEDDAARMIAALRLAADVHEEMSARLPNLHLSVDDRGTPLATLLAHDDATVVSFVRRRPGPYSHAVGTCRMGVESDHEAVVDVTGRVFGAVNLWVADASVFPDLPRAATQVPVMAVASRIARGVAERIG